MEFIFIRIMEAFDFSDISLMGFLDLFRGNKFTLVFRVSSDSSTHDRNHFKAYRIKNLKKSSEIPDSRQFDSIEHQSKFSQMIKSLECLMLIIN